MDYSSMTVDELRAAERRYNRSHNEGRGASVGEGYNPYTDALDARYEALHEATEATFETIWTADVTAARRIEWNTFAVKLDKGDPKAAWAQISAKETELGWTVADLKRAVALHNM